MKIIKIMYFSLVFCAFLPFSRLKFLMPNYAADSLVFELVELWLIRILIDFHRVRNRSLPCYLMIKLLSAHIV